MVIIVAITLDILLLVLPDMLSISEILGKKSELSIFTLNTGIGKFLKKNSITAHTAGMFRAKN